MRLSSAMRLITIQRFRETTRLFEKGSIPSPNTLRSWIDADEIPGKRIGNKYYIDLDGFDETEDQLVNAVLDAR